MRLSTPLQIQHLKQLFSRLNPDVDIQEVDFNASVGNKETYEESLEDIQLNYPQYQWIEADPYEQQAINALNEQANDYGLKVIKKGQLSYYNGLETRLKTLQEKVKQSPTYSPMVQDEIKQFEKIKVAPDVLDIIVKDLWVKPCLLIGARGAGKTVMSKHLVEAVINKGNSNVRCFDPSLAWYHSAPLMNRIHCVSGFIPDTPSCLYEVGYLNNDQRRDFISTVIGGEYSKRYTNTLTNPDYLATQKLDVTVLEESQALFEKYSKLPTPVHDWISIGRNLRMSGIICTQRPAELDTKIVERCNLLVGYCEGSNNLNKIRAATNKEFVERVKDVKMNSYEFVYFRDSSHFDKIRLPEAKMYPAPRSPPVENKVVVEKKAGFWERLLR